MFISSGSAPTNVTRLILLPDLRKALMNCLSTNLAIMTVTRNNRQNTDWNLPPTKSKLKLFIKKKAKNDWVSANLIIRFRISATEMTRS
jgi:hypothetical protein